MSKVGDLDAKLREAGIPIDGISLGNDGKVRIDYQGEVAKELRDTADQIVKDYDQAEIDAEKPTPLTLTEINGVKTIADAKAILLKLAALLNIGDE